MIEKSEALEKLYYDYTHLPLGGKKVRCPYWSNFQRILLTGPYRGKGKPGQIVKATREAAKKHGLDLSKLTLSDIRKFMEHHRIGVDCSGFVYQMADALDREKEGKGIFEKVKGVKGKGPRRVNAFCLTNEENTIAIGKVEQAKIGDFIRFNNGRHIAIILRIKRNSQNVLQQVVYAHSGRLSALTGVHAAKFSVIDPRAGLNKQLWFEKTRKGYDFLTTSFKEKEGDGLRRLKIWA